MLYSFTFPLRLSSFSIEFNRAITTQIDNNGQEPRKSNDKNSKAMLKTNIEKVMMGPALRPGVVVSVFQLLPIVFVFWIT